jgi:hypothetical protein
MRLDPAERKFLGVINDIEQTTSALAPEASLHRKPMREYTLGVL